MIDLQLILAALPNANKDAQRMGLFVAAVGKKSLELVESEPDKLQSFLAASSDLTSRWLDRARKMRFPMDLFSDPFKPLREETRTFAATWSLDPVFRTAMG